jgi:hypothetical protein
MDGVGDACRDGGCKEAQAEWLAGGWHVNLFNLKWTAIVHQIFLLQLAMEKYF